jgi:3-phenylpropionate/trans-cinnamate dioxygenase ferredoxin subunit
MAGHRVARVRDLPPGERVIVQIGSRSIGVFNVGGEFFALRNACPHQGGPLCEGQVLAAIRAPGPGEYEHGRPGDIVRCPWHAWEFDVRTGRSWFDPERTRVRSYPAHVETFPVSVEDDYVVVEA